MHTTSLRFVKESFYGKRAVFKTEGGVAVEVHGGVIAIVNFQIDF